MKKLAKGLIYASLVLISAYDVISSLSEHRIFGGRMDGIAGLVFAWAVLLFLLFQVNVLISAVLLIRQWVRLRRGQVFSKPTLLIHGLYFLLVFLLAYAEARQFRVSELNAVDDYAAFHLKQAWAMPDVFLSNVYLVLRLGAFKIGSVYNALWNAYYYGDGESYQLCLWICVNALLSFGIFLISVLFWLYSRRKPV